MVQKKDNSPKVYQRDKIREKLTIKDFPWTEKQKLFIELAGNKDNKIIICKSPPGTGKTALALYCSLLKLNDKRIGEIIYLRTPIESCEQSVGFLKGSFEEKIDKYTLPLFDVMSPLISQGDINYLIKDQRIKFDSIGFIKGRTYSVSNIICDEAEDLSIKSLELLIGRLGKYSQLFIIGDERQKDIRNSGFVDVYNLFNDDESRSNGIVTFEFTKEDIMRNPLLRFVSEKFEKLVIKRN